MLLDDEGRLATIPAVSEAYRRVPIERAAGYAPIAGPRVFLEAVVQDLLGRSELAQSAVAVATPGGTGALALAVSCFLEPGQSLLTSSFFWSPYQNRVWKPVICTVNGLCVGGGLHFVVDADVVVASANASFLDAHVNVGMVGAVENIGLARRLPLGTALRMTLQGRDFRLGARRAHELGMVDELVETPAEVLPAALAIAASMAKNSPRAMALSKQAVWGSLERGYRQALEHGWSLVRGHWSHPDFTEGGRAFAEKREPVWNPDPDARSDDERDS